MVKKWINVWKHTNWKAKSLYALWILFVIWIMQIMNLETTKENAKNDIENFARSNARYIAKGIWECIKSEVDTNWYTSKYDLQIITKNCWAEHRSWWPTWDFFVVNLADKTMFYDGSPDCLKGWELRPFDANKEKYYIENNIKEWECWMHQNPLLCMKAIWNLINIKTTDSNSKIYWQFDDSIEWLESYTIPTNSSWFKWPIWLGWVSNEDNIQLMVVVWTQKDEVYSQFTNVFDYWNKTENIIVFMALIFCVMLFITTLALKKCDNGNTDICDM